MVMRVKGGAATQARRAFGVARLMRDAEAGASLDAPLRPSVDATFWRMR
jgi:hypothetical protein